MAKQVQPKPGSALATPTTRNSSAIDEAAAAFNDPEPEDDLAFITGDDDAPPAPNASSAPTVAQTAVAVIDGTPTKRPTLTKEGGVIQFEGAEELGLLSVNAVIKKSQYLQTICQQLLHEGEHYGSIATGMKPSLFQPGAQVLMNAFRLRVEYEVTEIEHTSIGDGLHRTYKVTVRVYHIPTDTFLSEGHGQCSTLETKYRYRGNKVLTDVPVPKIYWNDKDENGNWKDEHLVAAYEAAGNVLETGEFIARDKGPDGKWMVAIRREGDMVENPNPSDFWNTAEKMGCKRAMVMGIINATGASVMFTQDVEDFDRSLFV